MYTPTPVPLSADAIPAYLANELQALSQSLVGSIPFLTLQTLNASPARPREGMVIKVDGVNFNPVPASGAGFYGYRAGAWRFLG